MFTAATSNPAAFAGLLPMIASMPGSSHGTPNNDRLIGSNGHDILVGGGGDDMIVALFGNDVLVGGAGNDTLNGGAGRDTADFSADAGIPRLSFVNQFTIAPGTLVDGVTLGGLSSIDYDPRTGTFYAMSDDQANPADAVQGPVRFHTLDLAIGADGLTGVTVTDTVELRGPGGAAYAFGSVDPEGIRYNPVNGTIVWTSEGFNTATSKVAPAITIAGIAGSHVRDLPVDDIFTPTATSGVRQNLAFEGLSFDPTYRNLFVSMEGAMIQDGLASTVDTGSVARIVQYDTATGRQVAQFAYAVDPVQNAPSPAGAFTVNGVVEILALSETQFVVVERSFSVGVPGNDIRLYLATTQGATDVSGLDSLAGASYAPMRKTLLADLDSLGITLDNIEGITRGPTLADGRQTIVLVSDDNFSAASVNQFLLFTIDGLGTPGVTANLETGTARSALGGSDRLINIENLIGSAADDSLTGNRSDNRLDGGAGHDSLSGGLGNDMLVGGAGNDVIDGGAGTDTAWYSGPSSRYTVTSNADGSRTVTDTLGIEGTDILRGIETIEFAEPEAAPADTVAMIGRGLDMHALWF